MRGSIYNATKSKSRAAAEAKMKVIEEEKKMSTLQQWLNKIRKAKIDEHNWPKHWVELREWEKRKNAWNLITSIIKSYLNAPIIKKFRNLKEEAAKFIVSRYHDRKIWLEQPITITGKLINFISGLPLNGEPIHVSSKNPTLLERFIGLLVAFWLDPGLLVLHSNKPLDRWPFRQQAMRQPVVSLEVTYGGIEK